MRAYRSRLLFKLSYLERKSKERMSEERMSEERMSEERMSEERMPNTGFEVRLLYVSKV